MFGYRLLALGSWLSFFLLFWQLLLGGLEPSLGTLSALVLFGMFGLAATGCLANESRRTAVEKEKPDEAKLR